jgi:hypothetical protein
MRTRQILCSFSMLCLRGFAKIFIIVGSLLIGSAEFLFLEHLIERYQQLQLDAYLGLGVVLIVGGLCMLMDARLAEARWKSKWYHRP